MEFLAEGHRHRILQLGAAHLQDLGEGLALGSERLAETVEAGQQGVVAEQQARRMAVGSVVGRLRHVHVVVRVQVAIVALGVAHGLQAEVGDHFVRVHVGRSAGAALDHVDDELLVELAADQPCAGLADGLVLARAEVAELAVGVGGGLLDHCQSGDQFRVVRQRHAGQAEVVQRAQRLDAVIGVGGHRKVPSRSFSIRNDAGSDMMVAWFGLAQAWLQWRYDRACCRPAANAVACCPMQERHNGGVTCRSWRAWRRGL